MPSWAPDRPSPKDTPKRKRRPPTQLALHVGSVLAAARGERGLRELARSALMQHVDLLRLERGEENPTLARVEQWAKALGGHIEVRFVPDEVDDA